MMVLPAPARQGRDLLPEFLGDERDKRVQQAQQCFQVVQQGFQHTPLARNGSLRVVQYGFGKFHVPVAEFIPGEFVQGLGRKVEAVTGNALTHLFRSPAQPGH